jgi:hypothetical protein
VHGTRVARRSTAAPKHAKTPKPSIEPAEFGYILHPKKRAFLIAYSGVGVIKQAAEAAGIDRQSHFNWMGKDAVYAAAFARAGDAATDSLEAEARRRAFEGSDTLLIFMLKGALPGKYRERYEHTGKDGADLFPAKVTVNLNSGPPPAVAHG